MGCIFVLLAALSPRLALALMWIFTPWVDRTFGPWIWPLLGLAFLPLTTLLYVILWNSWCGPEHRHDDALAEAPGGHGVTAGMWIFVFFAFLGDLASYGGSARRARYA